MHTKKSGHFWSKIFLWIFAFDLLIYVQKTIHSYLHLLFRNCSLTLLLFKDILKTYIKRTITLEKVWKIWKKKVLDNHMRNVMPKFQTERCGYNNRNNIHRPTYSRDWKKETKHTCIYWWCNEAVKRTFHNNTIKVIHKPRFWCDPEKPI